MAQEIELEFVRAEDGGDPHAVRRGVQEYLLRWPGGGYDAIRVVWDEARERDLVMLRDPIAGAEAAQRLGDWLQRTLATTQWRGHAEALARKLDGPLTVTIRAAAAELYAIPWELTTLPGRGEHLAALPDVRIGYRWPGASAVEPHPATRREGGRVVLAWSQAFGPVGPQLFIDAIEAEARDGDVNFDARSDVIADASLEGLVRSLEARCAAAEGGAPPPAVLHILCHGVAVGEGFGLGLDGPRGPDAIDAARLRALAPFARFVRLVVLTACDSANQGAPGSHLGSVALTLHRAGFEVVVASRVPLSGTAALKLTRTLYRHLLGGAEAVDEAVSAIRSELRVAGAGLDWAHLQLYCHARGTRPITFRPYRGLLQFDSAHRRFFFGRTAERDEAIADLDALIAAGRPRLLVVTGASGTGKSSTVLAGVVPALAARGIPTLAFRPGHEPEHALDAVLAEQPATGPCLIVVDQFEEVFTHGARRTDGASRFTRRLWQLAGDRARDTRVILTLRVDYLGRCGEVVVDDEGTRLDVIAYDERHRVFIAHMNVARLRETIDAPAARVGLTLADGLRERLLTEIGNEPGGLPLLQYALDELWIRRRSETLTHADLDALGGAVGALARRADTVLANMSEAERRAARGLLVRMVAFGVSPETGTRLQANETELRPTESAAWDRAVTALIDARLVFRHAREGRVYLDISHEALVRRWPPLWAWYEDERGRLAEQAQLAEWAAEWQRFPDNLLRGNKLGYALRLRERHGDELRPAVRELIDRSEAADRERQQGEKAQAAQELRLARRRIRVTLGASVILLAALVFAGVQWRAATRANREAARVREKATGTKTDER